MAALKLNGIVLCIVEEHVVITLGLNIQDFLIKVLVCNSNNCGYMAKLSV